jgi:hypothetical protein
LASPVPGIPFILPSRREKGDSMETYHSEQNSSPLVQDFIIDRDRSKPVTVIIMYAIISLLLLVSLALLSTSISYSSLFLPSMTSFTIFLIIIMLVELTSWWAIWGMARYILAGDPALIVNHQRIQISQLPMLTGNIFLSWKDVKTITVRYHLRQKYFVIYPKNPRQYLSRLPIWTQFIMRIRSIKNGGGSINIPQIYLKEPVEEILRQMSQLHNDELKQNRIEIRF